MSSIETIVLQAFQNGCLTAAMEAEVGRICDSALELSVEEYKALDRLMSGLLTGEIVAVPRKKFINVMEDLVLSESAARLAEIEPAKCATLDLGDIAAYALNRLPPLYATSEEGASYQKKRALAELQTMINQQVKEAIDNGLNRPKFFPERSALEPKPQDTSALSQLSHLLKAYAPGFESKSR